jgi:hypothetical protein
MRGEDTDVAGGDCYNMPMNAVSLSEEQRWGIVVRRVSRGGGKIISSRMLMGRLSQGTLLAGPDKHSISERTEPCGDQRGLESLIFEADAGHHHQLMTRAQLPHQSEPFCDWL